MKYNICSECKTENELDYKYCKNCGASLFEDESKDNDFTQNTVNEPQNDIDEEYISGVPISELACYIGAKSQKLLPKLARDSWCWPTAVLTAFFGPLGAALWFLYRKMYKLGFIFLAISVALNIFVIGMGGGKNVISDAALEEFILNYNSQSYSEMIDFLLKNVNVRALIGGYIDNILSIACLVITGIFGYKWYKNDSVKKIFNYRRANVDSRFYQIGLMSIGGTSVGAVVLGLIAYTSIPSVISLIVFMASRI